MGRGEPPSPSSLSPSLTSSYLERQNPWPCTHTIISLTPFYTIVFVHLPDWSSACYIPSCEFDLDLTPAIFVIEAEDDDSCLTVHERARPMVTYDDTRLGVCRKASEVSSR